MSIKDILRTKLDAIYSPENRDTLSHIGDQLSPVFPSIVDTFYAELMQVPELADILHNKLVEKNLRRSLEVWLRSLFDRATPDHLDAFEKRQQAIGLIHANININLNYVYHGIGILKREIYRILGTQKEFTSRFILLDSLFDTIMSIMAESYYSNEIRHENNELSLKFKGMTRNAPIECERLRTLLLDWIRTSLTYLYQMTDGDIKPVPWLRTSDFGLWVLYKSDYLSPSMNISDILKQHIGEIDQILEETVSAVRIGDRDAFSSGVARLNDAVTRASFYISSMVEEAMELDTGTDPLTKLFNRRYLDTIMRRQTKISLKQQMPYAVLLADIDFFKKVNDTWGHDAGDHVLRQFSEILLSSVRSSDFVFRYGGEEFCVVLGNAGYREAFQVAEKIRTASERHEYEVRKDKTIKATCSIGIAVFEGHPDYHRLIQSADKALYRAKSAGRNRCMSAESQGGPEIEIT